MFYSVGILLLGFCHVCILFVDVLLRRNFLVGCFVGLEFRFCGGFFTFEICISMFYCVGI